MTSYDSFAALKASQLEEYNNEKDGDDALGAAARLGLVIRFQVFEWLQGEIKRGTPPGQLIEALAVSLGVSATEVLMTIRSTAIASGITDVPSSEVWAGAFCSQLHNELLGHLLQGPALMTGEP